MTNVLWSNAQNELSNTEFFVLILAAVSVVGISLYVLSIASDKENRAKEGMFRSALKKEHEDWIVINGGVKLFDQDFYGYVIQTFDSKARPFAMLRSPEFNAYLFEAAGSWRKRNPENLATVLVLEIEGLKLGSAECINKNLLNRIFEKCRDFSSGAQKWQYRESTNHQLDKFTERLLERICLEVADRLFLIECSSNFVALFQQESDDPTRLAKIIATAKRVLPHLLASKSNLEGSKKSNEELKRENLG